MPLWSQNPLKLIHVRVKAGASRNEVKPLAGGEGEPDYQIWVTQAPEQGKANGAVLSLLAKYWGVAPSTLRIKRGLHHKDKWIERI